MNTDREFSTQAHTRNLPLNIRRMLHINSIFSLRIFTINNRTSIDDRVRVGGGCSGQFVRGSVSHDVFRLERWYL